MPRTGRPRNFDRDEAVVSAMHLFWTHGYEGTSLDQLRAAMGSISSASFYAAFRSKEVLYRETVDLYLRTHGQVVSALRDDALRPRDRVEKALRLSAVMQTAGPHPSGCMVTLSALVSSADGAPVQAITADERSGNRRAIHACVQQAVDDRDLLPSTDVTGLSTLVDALLMGLSIQARDGISSDAINAAITQALNAWDANAPADPLPQM